MTNRRDFFRLFGAATGAAVVAAIPEPKPDGPWRTWWRKVRPRRAPDPEPPQMVAVFEWDAYGGVYVKEWVPAGSVMKDVYAAKVKNPFPHHATEPPKQGE